MIDLNGTKFPTLPISELEKIRDLWYFDGPLLSEFRRKNGDRYLYYWCDCDEGYNRWMVLRVTDWNIARLEAKSISLDAVIPRGAQDDFVYFVDLDEEGAEAGAWLVLTSNVPGDYRPRRGAFLPGAYEDRSFPILLERAPDYTELAIVPRRMIQAHAFVYALNQARLPRIPNFPWQRGGFNSMHFFNWLDMHLPEEGNAKLRQVAYSSPGFMRFEADPNASRMVFECIETCILKGDSIRESYSQLSGYINRNGLNDLPRDSEEWPSYSNDLLELSVSLATHFDALDFRALRSMTRRPIEAAKLTMVFYYRIRDLARFQTSNFVQFPPAYRDIWLEDDTESDAPPSGEAP